MDNNPVGNSSAFCMHHVALLPTFWYQLPIALIIIVPVIIQFAQRSHILI